MRRFAVWLVLCLLAMTTPAAAQLYGLTFDRATATQQLAQIDPLTGSMTPIGSGLNACCELGLAAHAFDPYTQTLYSLGPDALGALQLLRHSLPAGNGSVIGSLGSNEHVVGLAFERSSGRLLALLATDAGLLRMVSINTSSGAVTALHSGLADCCVLEPGLAAVAGGNFLFVGRLRADVGSTRVLYAWSTSGSSALTTTPLPADTALVALVADTQSSAVFGLQQSISAGAPTLQLVQVSPGVGLTAVGGAVPNCCAVAIDNAAIEGNALRVVARSPAAPAGYSVMSFALSSGIASFSSGVLPSQRIVNGMFEQTKGLNASLTTITNVAPSPAVVGQPYTVTVSVSAAGGPLAGTLQVSDGLGGTCSFVLPSTSCQLSSTAAGPLTLTATYSGTGGTAGSTGTVAQTIVAATSSTSITSVVPEPSVVGQAYSVNVSVSGYLPSGSVLVTDGLGGNCSVVLPATSCALPPSTTGTRTLTASYPGDSNNLPSSTTATHDVVAAASTTVISSVVPNPVTVGQPATVTVSVSGFGAPSGTVVVSDGNGAGCSINLPAVSCVWTPISAGNRILTANYGGDANNLPSGGTLAATVDRAPSLTSIGVISPSPAIAGQPYGVAVTVSGYGTPSGAVVVSDGTGASCTITLPAGSCALTSASAGNKVLTANYAGDGNLLPSSDTDAQIVQQAPTTTVLAALPNPALVAVNVVLTATVNGGPGPRTGTLSFSADGNPIASCSGLAVIADSASCTTSFASEGTRTIVASYSGDANHLASTTTLTLDVSRAPTSTLLTANPNPVAPGAATTLSVSVSGGTGVLAGTVSISADGSAIAGCQNLVLSAGVAQCSSSFAAPGQIALLASYSGDSDDLPSNGALSLGVLVLAIPALDTSALLWLALMLALIGALALTAQRRD